MVTGDGSMPFGTVILLVIVFMALNALVVLNNTALNAVNRSILNQQTEKEHLTKVLAELLNEPSKYQFTNKLLIYITFTAGLFLSASIRGNRLLSIIIYIVASLVICEYIMRKVALQHNEGIAVKFAAAQKICNIVFRPFVVVLNLLSNIILIIFRQETKFEYNAYSEDQVMSILEEGQQSGQIKEEGKKMINSIFQFDDELAYEIMTPRTDVFVIDINDPTEEYIDELMELRYSRIPVCEDETDNIIGILHIKDYLIKARETGFDKVDIRSILRKPYFVPETKNIDSLFFELQVEKQHIAILIDEYGGFSGIVTMEDLVEEIVGEIDDEYDQEEHIIEKVDDNNYNVDGNVNLNDLDEELNINLQSDNSETIGGFLIDILGEIPEEGDENREIRFENFLFTILSVKERRIERVHIEILPEMVEDTNETDE